MLHIFRRTEHVRTAGDVESVPLQPIMDGSSAKKLHAPVRGTVSTSAISQSSDPISTNSGDGDDASVVSSVTRIKLVKKEVVLEASGGAGDVSSHSDLNQSFVLIGRVCTFMFPVSLCIVQIFIIFAFVCFAEMSALDYMLLNDPPGVEIEQI